jgi:hypothetical protein
LEPAIRTFTEGRRSKFYENTTALPETNKTSLSRNASGSIVVGACTPYEQGRHTVDQRRDVKEAKLKKLNGPIKTKRTDTIRKAIRHIWKKRASTFRTNRKRGPGKMPSHGTQPLVVATTRPLRGSKIMTSKPRKPLNQRSCSLFQIEGYERLLATTSRVCRKPCLFVEPPFESDRPQGARFEWMSASAHFDRT